MKKAHPERHGEDGRDTQQGRHHAAVEANLAHAVILCALRVSQIYAPIHAILRNGLFHDIERALVSSGGSRLHPRLRQIERVTCQGVNRVPSRYKYLVGHVPTNTAQTPPNPPAMKDFTDSVADPPSLSSTAGASLLCAHECC